MKFSKEHQPENRRRPDVLTALLKEWLNKPYSNQSTTIAERLVEVLLNEAMSGNLKAIQLIWERVEGKPPQHVEVNQSGNKLPEVIYVQADTGVKPYLHESEVQDPTEVKP